MKKKSPIAMMILEEMGSSKKKEEESEEDEGRMGLESAAEEILSAMKEEDASALTDALLSFVEQC